MIETHHQGFNTCFSAQFLGSVGLAESHTTPWTLPVGLDGSRHIDITFKYIAASGRIQRRRYLSPNHLHLRPPPYSSYKSLLPFYHRLVICNQRLRSVFAASSSFPDNFRPKSFVAFVWGVNRASTISMWPSEEPVKPELSDYYFDLIISQDATSGEIKKAFHILARLHHPDKKVLTQVTDAIEFRQVRMTPTRLLSN